MVLDHRVHVVGMEQMLRILRWRHSDAHSDVQASNCRHYCEPNGLHRAAAAIQAHVGAKKLQHALLQALALLSAAGPAGKSDALRHRDTAADTACRCW